MRQKLNLVTLGVRDLAKSREFYQKGLGWKPSSASQESIAFFDLGGVALALYSREELAADATIAAAGTGFSGLTAAGLAGASTTGLAGSTLGAGSSL